MKRKSKNKGFTLVELIIVIAILAIIMLIASLAYVGIQQRMRIRSDKATCGEIGKALAVREADLDKSKGIKLYPEVVEYDSLEKVEDYIKPGLTPQSMPDGGYIVTAIQTDTGKKIIVGIGKNDQEISTDLYVDNSGAGWAWTEGKEVSKFVEENNSKFTPVKTLAGITGGSSGGGSGGGSNLAVNKVQEGDYIDYTGGDYTGKWVVLRNSGGTIEIISKESVKTLKLGSSTDFEKPKNDYANAVQILNDECSAYVNSTYATSARSVGATSSSIGQIDRSKYSLSNGVSGEPYEDTNYQSDVSIINGNEYLQSSENVWLASRCLVTHSNRTTFGVRYLDISGSVYYGNLFGVGIIYSHSKGVRPVITLKSGIKITGGTGDVNNPYTIEI